MMLCPKCLGKNDGSCPTCHAHNYLVAPVEYNLVQQVTKVMRSRLLAGGETPTTTPVTTADYWLKWAYDRVVYGKAGSWDSVNRLAEKRAELAIEALKPMYKSADMPWDDEHLPQECNANYWIERAKKQAADRVSCQTHKVEITELMSVTDAINLQMEP